MTERIAEVRQLYLDTLKDWPHDELPTPELYKRANAPAKKAAETAAAKTAAKKTTAKKATAKKATAKKTAAKTATKKAGAKGRP